MNTQAERWGVIVEGHQFDLEDLVTHHFPKGGDPWVEWTVWEGEGHKAVLKSTEFRANLGAFDVHGLSQSLVERLATVLLMNGGESVKCGAIVEFREGVTPVRHVVGSCAVVLGRARCRAAGVVLDAGGNAIQEAVVMPTGSQGLLHLAAINEDVADALHYFASVDSWFDLYKCLEAIGVNSHRLKDKLSSAQIASKSAISDLTMTCNYYRHHRANRPNNLLSFEDCRKLTGAILKFWINLKMQSQFADTPR